MLIRIVDCETTGLDPAVHRVCEIAMVDMIVSDEPTLQPNIKMPPVHKVERGAMWSSLVNPERPIPPEASAVHDITDEMVKDAPKIGDLVNAIIGGVPDFKTKTPCPPPDYWCAYNNRFDMKFINPPGAVWLDVYRIALWLWPDAPEHKLATLRYWLKLNLSISKIGPVNGWDHDGHLRNHRAMWDAYVRAAVLRRAFMAGATVEQMLEVSSQPALLPRLRFGEHAGKPIEDVPSSYLQWIVDKFEREKEDERHTAFAELQRRRNLGRLQERTEP